MHQMVDVSKFDNEYRPDLQLYHEICHGNSLILMDGWMFELFIDAQP